MVTISVVIPILNEENNIEPLTLGLSSVLENLNRSYEIIFVDDGSTDRSFDILSLMAKNNPRIKVIKFARNFGQTAAIATGINYAKGDIIVLMDGDLQNDPKDIPRLLKQIDAGYDVVSGWRRKRQDPLLTKKIPSYLANKLIAFLTKVKLHDFGCTLKAYRAEAIKGIELYGEMHRFLPIYSSRAGYIIAEIEVSHHKRISGRSKYGLNRIFKIVLDLLTLIFFQNYSTRPNYIFGGCGLVFIFISFLFFIWTLIYQIQKGILLSFAIFSFGFQLILIGLFSEMIMRIYYGTISKGPYLIKTIIDSENQKG